MKTFTLARLKRYLIATAVYAVLLSLLVFVIACEQPTRQERFIGDLLIAGQAAAYPQPIISEWKPRVREFTLEDGTRCVAVSTRATNFPKDSGFSGLACDWKE